MCPKHLGRRRLRLGSLLRNIKASRLRRWAGAGLIALGILGLLLIATDVLRSRVPKFEDVKADHRPSDAWLVDRNGQPLESLRVVNSYRSLEWVSYEELSPAFIETLVKAEDRRFFSHHGVDFFALGSAARAYLSSARARGASTITMQLAKLLEKDSKESRALYKLRQIFRAFEIELSWSKAEILEAYVNRVSYRGEVSGLRAASLGFFQKSPHALDRTEAAILVALIRSPNATLDKVQARAEAMVPEEARPSVGLLAREILEQPLKLRRERTLVPVISKSFIEKGEGSSVIQTTLDAKFQSLAMDAIEQQLERLKRQNVKDAAVLILETKTGRVLAYVANGGPNRSSAVQIDGVKSLRQVGSTIKAFVYGTAFDKNLLSTTSLLLDSPENVAVGSGQVYQPRNYDHLFRGNVGVAEALGSSLNVPAVRALSVVGERAVIEKLHALGFSNLKDEDQYGPSLALGTVDATLWDLTQGYRQLSLSSDSKVFSDSAKNMLFDSLAAPENRRFTFGLSNLLELPFPAAVKTGTSKDMRDNWCVGYTSEFTVGAWVGNFNGDPMWNVSGMSGAAPLWRNLMLALHRDHLPSDRVPEYKAPDAPLKMKTIARIRYPVKEMLIGLDPDIPNRLQKVPFRADGAMKGYAFYLNNRRLGLAEREPFWSPVKGRHRVSLKDAKGKIVDQLEFVVR